jgi:hypothetical protein
MIGRLICGEQDVLSISSQVLICPQNHLKPHPDVTLSPSLPSSPIAKTTNSFVHVLLPYRETLSFKLALRDSSRFQRHEGSSFLRMIRNSSKGLIEDVWYIHICEERGG